MRLKRRRDAPSIKTMRGLWEGMRSFNWDDALVLADAFAEHGYPSLAKTVSEFAQKAIYFERVERGERPPKKKRGRIYTTSHTAKDYAAMARRIETALKEIEEGRPTNIKWYSDRGIITPVEVLGKDGDWIRFRRLVGKGLAKFSLPENLLRLYDGPAQLVVQEKLKGKASVRRWASGALRFIDP